MKYFVPFIIMFAVAASLCIVLYLGYIVGYREATLNAAIENQKDYQAACILNSVCQNMMDNIGTDAEEIYYDAIDNLDCHKDIVVTKKDITKYNWRY